MMLKLLNQRGSFSHTDMSTVSENAVATCQPRRSQRHSNTPTSLPSATELAVAEDEAKILLRLPRLGQNVAPNMSDETEPLQSSCNSTVASAMTDVPQRSRRSHRRSRFMDEEYFFLSSFNKTGRSDSVKALVQQKGLANEPAAKRRLLKSLSSLPGAETRLKNSQRTAIHLTSSVNRKGANRVVTRSLGPVVRYPVGTRLKVKFGNVNPQIYEAKVINVDASHQVPRYRVHYRGWNKSHDSWITKVDIVSVIERPSSPATSTKTEAIRSPSDITPKDSSKVCPADGKLSGSLKGSSKIPKDSKAKASKETDLGANTSGRKRKQNPEEDEGKEDGVEMRVKEGRIRLRRKRRRHLNNMSSADENQDGGTSQSSSAESSVVEEVKKVESKVWDETDRGNVESFAEKGIFGTMVVPETAEQEKPEKDRDAENGPVADGQAGANGTEQENGKEDMQEKEYGVVTGKRDEEDTDDYGQREDSEWEDKNVEEEYEEDDEEEDEEKDEKEDEEEENGEEMCSFDSEDQSAAQIIPISDCKEAANCPLGQLHKDRASVERDKQNLPGESYIRSLGLPRARGDKKTTEMYDSVRMSESSCESDVMEPVYSCDAETTAEDFLEEEPANDYISVSNSNSDDACNELLPAENDSIRSGGTLSIASDQPHRSGSSGNTTTSSSSSQLSQLDDAEGTRHFARLSRSPAYRTNFFNLEAELEGLSKTERVEHILQRMREIQIEYKHTSSMYNKLTRKSNKAGNQKRSRSRRHGNAAVATADTEASSVC